jgi:hypothetical protein
MPWWGFEDIEGGRDRIIDHRGRAVAIDRGERESAPRKGKSGRGSARDPAPAAHRTGGTAVVVWLGLCAYALAWQIVSHPRDWMLKVACLAASGGLAWVALHQNRRQRALAATAEGTARVRAALGELRCPACSYALAGIERDGDDLIVCPECSAAWNMDAGLTPPGRLQPDVRTPPRHLKLEHERPEIFDALGRPAPFLLRRSVEDSLRTRRRAVVRAFRARWKMEMLLVPLAAVCVCIVTWYFGSQAGLPWREAIWAPVALCVVWLAWGIGSAMHQGVCEIAAETVREGMCPCCCDPFAARGDAITRCGTCGGWWLASRAERGT